tara:strand:- start:3227 stop:3394 length:168 start_codon:yes stop_codon:yes gene_type:complete
MIEIPQQNIYKHKIYDDLSYYNTEKINLIINDSQINIPKQDEIDQGDLQFPMDDI